MLAQSAPQALRLPPLRQDIRIERDAASPGGAPRWLLHDPVRNSFYEIGPEAHALLSLWSSDLTAPELAAIAAQETGRTLGEGEVEELQRFLNSLGLVETGPGAWREVFGRHKDAKKNLFSTLMHNYLFFRIPLWEPERFLKATLPLWSVLAGRVATTMFMLLGAAGIYLAQRQWADLLDGLQRQLSLSGAMLFAATIFCMKIVHELAHGYAATARGIRVRSMGVAFMLLAPMLYTDVTEAWRLKDRKQRMAIDLAGVKAEMAIACIGILAWAVLPTGQARDIALVVSTSAIVMTLMVNLNPFMRFDGYFILSDWLGIKNLQPRSFALMKWSLREALFNLGICRPDSLGGRLSFVAIVYGYLTTIYRFFLFLGIALVVYFMFFKALGIAMFLIEIFYFILLPIWREVKVWVQLRSQILASPRGWATALILTGAGLFALMPLSTRVQVAAVLEPADFVRVYPFAPSEIRGVLVRAGTEVSEGQIIIVLGSSRLEKELDVANARIALLDERLARRVADAKEQAMTLQLLKDRAAQAERRDALLRQIDGLLVRAPRAGVVTDLDPGLHVGRQVAREDELLVITSGRRAVIRGFADQQDVWRLKVGQHGSFIPDDLRATKVSAKLNSIGLSASQAIDIAHLAEPNGGPLRTHPPRPNTPLTPIDAIHAVELSPVGGLQAPARPIRGMVMVEAAPQSLAASLWRRVLKVLVQESAA
jgi:putative peptide zinc metalloprotease protein